MAAGAAHRDTVGGLFDLSGKRAMVTGASGGVAETVALDVTDSDAIGRAFIDAAPFDIVVNNAGVSNSARALEIEPSQWDAVSNVNLRGPFLVAKAAARAMRAAGQPGSIVNVASILGLRVASDVSAYAATKAGLIQLTKALALEWIYRYARQARLVDGADEVHKMVLNRTLETEGSDFWSWPVERPHPRDGVDFDAP